MKNKISNVLFAATCILFTGLFTGLGASEANAQPGQAPPPGYDDQGNPDYNYPPPTPNQPRSGYDPDPNDQPPPPDYYPQNDGYGGPPNQPRSGYDPNPGNQPPSGPPAGYGNQPPPQNNYQPRNYSPPAPIRRRNFGRRGLTAGASMGLGVMKTENSRVRCGGRCDYQPAAVGLDLNVGLMLSPNLALAVEYALVSQQIDNFGNSHLNQHMFLATAKLWLSRMLWLKGGLGAAALNYTYDDGFQRGTSPAQSGTAAMAAVGVELISTNSFALDLQLRLASGNYDNFDTNLNSGLIQVGISFF